MRNILANTLQLTLQKPRKFVYLCIIINNIFQGNALAESMHNKLIMYEIVSVYFSLPVSFMLKKPEI